MTDPYGRNELPKAPLVPSFFSPFRPLKLLILFMLWLSYYSVPSDYLWSKDNESYGDALFLFGAFLAMCIIVGMIVAIFSHKIFLGAVSMFGLWMIFGAIRTVFHLDDWNARMHWRNKFRG